MKDYGMQLWESGCREGVAQMFYDLPLNEFQVPLNSLLLVSMLSRMGEDGPISSVFMISTSVLTNATKEIKDVELVPRTEGCALSVPLTFDLRATLLPPVEDVCPFMVREITAVHLPFGLFLDGADEDVDSTGLADREDDDDWDETYFPISVHYQPIIERLAASCKLLLKRATIGPREISLLGKLQYALQRLPRTTQGINLEVVLSQKTDAQGSWCGLSLELSENRLSVDYVGYIRGPFGGDSDCQRVYDCESGGYCSDYSDGPLVTKDQLGVWLADWDNGCIDTSMTLRITDHADEFDWDQEGDDDAWPRIADSDG